MMMVVVVVVIVMMEVVVMVMYGKTLSLLTINRRIVVDIVLW
jgi:hypothetical protein